MTRRRQRKQRLTRMDAALDAMAPLGFPEEKVKKQVKQLLRVYGDGGWPFIEDSAYKELIECLLRDDDEENDQEKGTDNCCNSKDNYNGDETTAPEASSRLPGRQQYEKLEDITPVETAESSPAVVEPPQPKSVSSSSCLSTVHDGMPAEGGDDVWNDILLPHPFKDTKETGNKSGKETSPVKNLIPTSSLPWSNVCHPGSDHPPRWHRPYYDWIQSDKEDDLGCFRKLTPASIQFGPMLASSPCSTSPSKSKQKRRSRWDVKPWDPY